MVQQQTPPKKLDQINRLFRIFFATWIAFSYLGVALFYPATCDPSGIHDEYISVKISDLDNVILWETDTLEYSENFPNTVRTLAAHDSTQYITSSSSSNTSWLLHSRLPTTTPQTFVIDVMAIVLLAHRWENDPPNILTPRLWLSQFHHQFKAKPPTQPPQLLA